MSVKASLVLALFVQCSAILAMPIRVTRQDDDSNSLIRDLKDGFEIMTRVAVSLLLVACFDWLLMVCESCGIIFTNLCIIMALSLQYILQSFSSDININTINKTYPFCEVVHFFNELEADIRTHPQSDQILAVASEIKKDIWQWVSIIIQLQYLSSSTLPQHITHALNHTCHKIADTAWLFF